MGAGMRSSWRRSMLLVAFIYAAVGVLTAELAKSADSMQMRSFWRLAAWGLSLVVFSGHVGHERFRARSVTKQAALHVAAAVALGTFALAAVGPVRAHWNAADFWRTAVLSLPLWPVLTSVPAFLVALLAGSLLDRVADRERPAS
jgi:hypothetical protein